MEKNFDLKEMLKNGFSAEHLLNEFAEQLESAENELAREEAEEKKRREEQKEESIENARLAGARERLVDAILCYGQILKIIPNDIPVEMRRDIVKFIEESEKELEAELSILRLLSSFATAHDSKEHESEKKKKLTKAKARVNVKDINEEEAEDIIRDFLDSLI